MANRGVGRAVGRGVVRGKCRGVGRSVGRIFGRSVGRGVVWDVGRGVDWGGKHITLFKKYVKMFIKFKLILSPINIKTDKRKSSCYLKVLTVKIINIV